jgi:hypothetical protein
MKKIILLVFYLSFFGTVLLTFANEGRVTFGNDAQKAGVVWAIVHYENGKRDTVKGTVWHPEGASNIDKAQALTSDFLQCVGAVATNLGNGTVKIESNGANGDITEIDIIDNTNQRISINSSDLNDDILTVGIKLEGVGSCVDGMAYLSLDDCGESISIPTYEKTGVQVAEELASGIINCNAELGATIVSYSMGGGETGVIRFLDLPPEFSTITFDTGGDCGFSAIVSMGTNPETIPTLTQWGVIILLLLVLAIGMVFLYQRQISLAMAGVVETSNAKPKLFDRKLFAKVFAVALLIGLAGLVAAYLYYGQINNADPFGTAVSAGIVAYMAHLWLMRKSE